ncbi:MAG: recombinase family protein [Clostridiales Family XIII bacterium]|jgi:DNA invertase Pin-like site-specific DNA recombinase|nr:recombinase family protein [Clostridiales Family XIII bacterium]
MDNRIDAAYARQSVDKKDSISIESQLEFCGHELKGGSYKAYTDKGFSGKNTDRPDFQNLLRDIRAGLIRRVVVYKLDRISRSIIDFANMMELFQKHGVEFVSSTEKFDTSTPMGRAMLNICIVFAQLERETIQKRVTDAYYSRNRKGFRMGGKIPYGFRTEPFVMLDVKTKKLAPNLDDIENVRMLFDLYSRPEVSLGDVARRFAEMGVQINDGGLQRMTLSKMLRNPVYVRADMDVHEFFKSQGADIINDAADFMGVNGCYLYKGRDQERKELDDLAGQTLVLAPHEGVVSSDVWLKCRRKAMNNSGFQPARKATNTWLAGKAKCGRCGYALMSATATNGTDYMRCKKRTEDKGCDGAGTLKTAELERAVYEAMAEKLREFHTLTKQDKGGAVNPKVTALKVELARVENEIEKLLDTLTDANDILISYANTKIVDLDAHKQGLAKRLADLAADDVSPDQMLRISEFLEDWENTGIDDRRAVADALINRINATSESVDIVWKI